MPRARPANLQLQPAGTTSSFRATRQPAELGRSAQFPTQFNADYDADDDTWAFKVSDFVALDR